MRSVMGRGIWPDGYGGNRCSECKKIIWPVLAIIPLPNQFRDADGGFFE